MIRILGLALIIFFILLRIFQNRLIFHPDPALIAAPSDFGLTYEDLDLTAEDGVRLHAWYIKGAAGADPEPARVLFLHGNAGNISHFLSKTVGLAERGLDVLMLDYRGFGRSRGQPSEEGTYLDAVAAYDHLVYRPGASQDKTIIYGYSLGGAAAVELAVRRPVKAMILESTFTSIRDMARATMPFVPPFMVRPMFESQAKIAELNLPVLFVHGTADDLVPASMAHELHRVHPGPHELYLIPGADHVDTDLVGGADFFERLTGFIRRWTRD